MVQNLISIIVSKGCWVKAPFLLFVLEENIWVLCLLKAGKRIPVKTAQHSAGQKSVSPAASLPSTGLSHSLKPLHGWMINGWMDYFKGALLKKKILPSTFKIPCIVVQNHKHNLTLFSISCHWPQPLTVNHVPLPPKISHLAILHATIHLSLSPKAA